VLLFRVKPSGALLTEFHVLLLLAFRYGRIEVLVGFVNAVALFFAAFGIVWEAGERLITPEIIHTDKLLLVAVLGLGVNLGKFRCVNLDVFRCCLCLTDFHSVGIFAFDHAALHGGHGGHGHSHSHGGEHDHDHGDGKEKSTWNPLLHGGLDFFAAKCGRFSFSTFSPGMFLHILADTLGSVGVITSAILVDWFGGLNLLDLRLGWWF